MTAHKGMRPQDVLVLLKLASRERVGAQTGAPPLTQQELAASLGISQSEVSASLRRSRLAGLLSVEGPQVHPQALLDFLLYGLRYVFPAAPGPVRRGWPTAHSAPPISQHIASAEPYVWPASNGPVRGESVEPLYPTVPFAAQQDADLYALLALTDALRVGRAREINLAHTFLKDYLHAGPTG